MEKEKRAITDDIGKLEEIIGYSFKDKKILEQALTHSSYANDYLRNSALGNERLEFLGDAIIDMVIGAELFSRFPDKQEGFLSKLRSEMVCEDALANAAIQFGINEYLKLGRGEEQKGGRQRHSLISDMMEAIVAAVFVDGGIDKSTEVVYKLLGDTIERGCRGELPKDYKSDLQEYFQSKGKKIPSYKILDESGPDHNKVFKVGVYEDNVLIGEGQGKSKKEAEGNAAKAALMHTEEKCISKD